MYGKITATHPLPSSPGADEKKGTRNPRKYSHGTQSKFYVNRSLEKKEVKASECTYRDACSQLISSTHNLITSPQSPWLLFLFILYHVYLYDVLCVYAAAILVVEEEEER